MSIALRGVTKQFGEYAAVENIDLDVATGALMALLGPSGSGKTTLLRIIGGLETPDEGQVLFDGRDATLWPIGDRKVGFVFQQYALFRHMTVFENVEKRSQPFDRRWATGLHPGHRTGPAPHPASPFRR